MAENRRIMPAWPFVGVMMVCRGFLILATGLFEIFHSPSTILANLHPAVGWDAPTHVSGLFIGAQGLRGSRLR